MSGRSLLPWLVSVPLAAIVSVSCTKSNSSNPTGPGGTAENVGSVVITVNPNPVPFSGVPVTDEPGCAVLPNTWYYDQVFTETAGVEVTFTSSPWAAK